MNSAIYTSERSQTNRYRSFLKVKQPKIKDRGRLCMCLSNVCAKQVHVHVVRVYLIELLGLCLLFRGT